MNITSKRSIFSILAGIVLGGLAITFLRPTCWAFVIAVFVAAYLAKVSTPKEGATVGAVVLLPIGIYWYFLQIPADAIAKTPVGRLGNVIGFFLGLLLLSGVGALYGLILGKLFQLMQSKRILF